MEKLYTYTLITVGLMIVLNMFGIASASGIILGQLGLTEVGALQTYQDIWFFAYLRDYALVALVALAGIAIITQTVSDLPTSALIASLIFLAFIGDLASVPLLASTAWERNLLFLIIAPLVIGYSVALFDWVRGKD